MAIIDDTHQSLSARVSLDSLYGMCWDPAELRAKIT